MRSASAPVFVVGAARSGTTLLQHVLANCTDVFTPEHETQYFSYLDLIRRRFDGLPEAEWRRELAVFIRDTLQPGFRIRHRRAWRPDPEALARTPPITTDVPLYDYAAAFGHVLDTVALQMGRRRWLEKSPGHVFARKEIMESFPSALVVEIVRDPRDVIASHKTLYTQLRTSDRYRPEVRERRRLELSFDPFWDSLRWRSAISAGADGARRWTSRWRRVRYEDLVDDPARTVGELCMYLGLDFEPGMLEVARQRPADIEMRNETGVSPSSVGRWRSTLTDSEAAICQAVCRSEMMKLGYERATLPVGQARMWVEVFARSSAEILVRSSRRLRRGGVKELALTVRYYMRRVVASLLPGK